MSPLPLTILLALPTPVQDVRGLTAGEFASVLAPAAAPAPDADTEREWLTGRVFHALTGAGLAGVRVRVFGEDYFDPREPVTALAQATSAADGTWSIALADPWRAHVEKLLFDLEGFRGTEKEASGTRGEDLALFPSRSAQVAILDLAGRPIPGAVVSSTITCSHAPPSFVALADRRGIVDLGAIPPGWDGGELQVSAPGFGVLDDVDGWDLVLRGIATGDASLYLPRRSTVRARILGAGGEPLQAGRILWQGDPWRVARIRPGGLVELAAPARDRDGATVFLLNEAGMDLQQPIALPRAPRGRVLTTRVDSLEFNDEWDGRLAAVTVRFEHEDVQGWDEDPRGRSRPGVAFLHESGHAEFRSERGVYAVPHGAHSVVIGGAFTGWCEQVVELTVDGSRELALTPRREPRLVLEVAPEVMGVELVVQAGDDSIVVSAGPDEDSVVYVPPAQPVILAWNADDGSMHTRVLGVPEPDQSVRIDASAMRLSQAFDPSPESARHAREPLVVGALDTSGRPIEGLDTSALVGVRRVSPAEVTETSATFELPAGLPYSVRVEARGYVTRYQEGRAGAEPRIEVVLRREARVALAGSFHSAFMGGKLLTAAEAAEGSSLAPGAARVVILFADGRRTALDLVLAEGARRRIELR